MTEILFIGSFLSKKRGTVSIVEKLEEYLSQYFKIRLVSRYENRVLRLFDIIIACIFFKGKTVHIDVFSDGAFRIAQTASFILKLRNKRIIYTLRGGKLAEFCEANKTRCLKVMRRADEIYSPSNFLKDAFERHGVKVNYLPNPVHLEHFVYQAPSTENRLLWVRAFAEIYNPELPVKIVALLKEEFPGIQLTMIGPDIGLLSKVKAEITRLKVGKNIEIKGPVKNEDLPDYFHSHTLFLNTPSYESFGTAVIESAACGCPIVSYAVGEIPFIWKDGENILMSGELTAEAFAEPIRRLLASETLRKEIAERACLHSKDFAWEGIVSRWKEILGND